MVCGSVINMYIVRDIRRMLTRPSGPSTPQIMKDSGRLEGEGRNVQPTIPLIFLPFIVLAGLSWGWVAEAGLG